MKPPTRSAHAVPALVAALTATLLAACSGGSHAASTTTAPTPPPAAIRTIPDMPPVVDPANIYSEARAGALSPPAHSALARVYVPDRLTNNVSVIDPATRRVVGVMLSGPTPQHVVPAYDLTRLWVANNAEGSTLGSLTPIDPATGQRAGPNVAVDDPYNLYFTPDGSSALVVAEALRRLDFRDPRTMARKYSIAVPTCAGINHMDFSIDGRYLIATCEDAHSIVKIDWIGQSVVSTLDLGAAAVPQDIRLSADGKTFYVADMAGNRLVMIDGDTFAVTGSIDLASSGGFGAHGLYPSRDGRRLYVANRGSAARGTAPPHGRGSVSVVDFSTNQVVANWTIPGGGSPDMGGVNADGTELWLSGRYDNEVYVFDTVAGALKDRISTLPAGREPHGLCVWPQPGRYSLGHTGNLR